MMKSASIVGVGLVVLLAAICLPAFADDAPQAAPVPPDSAVKASAVHGLDVAFYDFYPKDATGIDSIAIAKNWIANHQPTLTYRLDVTAVSFPPGAAMTVSPLNTTMGDFLLGKEEYAKRKEAAENGGKALPARFVQAIGSRTIYVFTGFIKVDKAGTYVINAPCDDGDEVSMGGVVVHARPTFGGITPPEAPENTGHVEFAEKGIYPLKVILYDRDPGSLGIHVFSNLDPKSERHANGLNLLSVLRPAK
jgi:hypothetical protein